MQQGSRKLSLGQTQTTQRVPSSKWVYLHSLLRPLKAELLHVVLLTFWFPYCCCSPLAGSVCGSTDGCSPSNSFSSCCGRGGDTPPLYCWLTQDPVKSWISHLPIKEVTSWFGRTPLLTRLWASAHFGRRPLKSTVQPASSKGLTPTCFAIVDTSLSIRLHLTCLLNDLPQASALQTIERNLHGAQPCCTKWKPSTP